MLSISNSSSTLSVGMKEKYKTLVTCSQAFALPLRSNRAGRWSLVSSDPDLPEPTAHQLSSKGKIGKLRPCVVFLPALPFQPSNNHQKSFKNLPVLTKLDTMKRFRNNFVRGVQHEVSTTANSVSLLVLLGPCSERAFKLWLSNNCDSSPVTSINIREGYSLFK